MNREQMALNAMYERRLASTRRYNGALFPSRAAHLAAVKRALLRAGLPPKRATYDAAGNCTTCGEAGRCPGYHPEERE